MLEYQDLVTDESVKTLVSLPQISQLNLSHTKVTARGLGWFQKSKTLKCVYVHECPALPAKDLYRLMSDKTNRVSIIGAFKDPQHVDGLEASGN